MRRANSAADTSSFSMIVSTILDVGKFNKALDTCGTRRISHRTLEEC